MITSWIAGGISVGCNALGHHTVYDKHYNFFFFSRWASNLFFFEMLRNHWYSIVRLSNYELS